MPQFKILVGSDQITLETETVITSTTPEVLELVRALSKFREQIVNVTDILIERLHNDVFDYTLTTGAPSRTFAQTWYLEPPAILVGYRGAELAGKWTVDELLATIGLRSAIAQLHATVGLIKLTCKW